MFFLSCWKAFESNSCESEFSTYHHEQKRHARHAGRRGKGRGCIHRRFRGRRAEAGDGPHHGAGCHCIRHGQPRAGDHTRGGQGGGRARDGHGPQRLSQPDQQRSGLPRHLPRHI